MNSEQQTTSYYDTEAQVYDENRYGSGMGRRVDLFHRRVLEELLLDQMMPDQKLIELGCGTGRLTAAAAAAGQQVTGVDISTGMLSVARRRFEAADYPPPRLIAGKLDALPIEDACFDAAFAVLVLNLMQDLDATLREIARVLKPGGALVFNLPNLASMYFPGGVYVNLRGRTVTRNAAGYRSSRWYTRGQVRRSLEQAGFLLERAGGQPPWAGAKDGARLLPANAWGQLLAKSMFYRAIKTARW